MSNYLNSCKQTPALGLIPDVLPAPDAITKILQGTLVKTIRIWMQRHRQRRRLAELSLRMLNDIGVTSEQAERESRKPFWVE